MVECLTRIHVDVCARKAGKIATKSRSLITEVVRANALLCSFLVTTTEEREESMDMDIEVAKGETRVIPQVERGHHLIAVIPHLTAVILQVLPVTAMAERS